MWKTQKRKEIRSCEKGIHRVFNRAKVRIGLTFAVFHLRFHTLWKKGCGEKENVENLMGGLDKKNGIRLCFSARLSVEFFDDRIDLVFERAVLGDLSFDDVDGGEQSGMIASEDLGDIFQGESGSVSDDVDGDMAGERDFRGTFFALDIFHADVIAFGDIFDDLFRDDGGGDGTGDHAGEDVTGGIDGNFGTVDEAVSAEFFDDAFELTDIAFDVFAEEIEHVVGEVDVHQLRFSFEDGDTEFGIRGLDIDDQTAFESALDAFFQVLNVLGGTVGGEDDLFSGIVKGIEGMEEFFLSRNLAGDELDIVDQEHVGVSVFFFELRGCFFLDGADEFVCEVFAFDEDDIEVRLGAFDFIGDGFHQVSFSEAGSAVEEEGVVGGRIFGNGDGSGVGELIGAADDEVIEGVVFVGDERGVVGFVFFFGGVDGGREGCGRDGRGWDGSEVLREGVFQNESGFGEDPDVQAEIEGLFKDACDIGSVLFVEDIHEILAGGGDERAFIVEIDEFKVFEPEFECGFGVFLFEGFVDDRPYFGVGVQIFPFFLSLDF